MDILLQRMIRAAKLDADLYEEVEADKSAIKQAIIVVVLSSVAFGIGTIDLYGIKGVISITVISLITWFLWAYVVYFIGVKILPTPETKSDHGELLRTIGFSHSPGVLRILLIIPLIGPLIFFVVEIWTLVAMVIAVRQALDYTSTYRAFGVCVIGWIIYSISRYILAIIFGVTVPS